MMKMKFLKDYDGVRNNNFTLLRTIFALIVLFGHAFAIAGDGIDPISQILLPYTWIGELAVGGFFAISGFLVTASFERRGILQYIFSRILRIYPAIFVYCVVAVLVIGPLGSSVGVWQYFATDAGQYFKNALLWTWDLNLPYNFQDRPIAGGTNGSMWTLPIEVRSYLAVFALGLIGVWRSRVLATLSILALYYIFVLGSDLSFLFAGEERYRQPISFFLIGCLAWVNRDLVPLCAPITIAVGLGQLFFLDSVYWLTAHSLCFTYIIFYVVYCTRHFDIDKKLGDVSFGLYIYAWPIQQLVWYPGQSGYMNALFAIAIVLPIAYLSWRYVEKPALRLKSRLLGRLEVASI